MSVYKKSISTLCLSCGALIAGSLFLSMKGSQAPSSELECQKLIIKGPDGKPAMILDATGSIPTISLFDKKGGANVVVSGGQTPSFTIKNPNQEESISLCIDKDQMPMLLFKDKKKSSEDANSRGRFSCNFLKKPK